MNDRVFSHAHAQKLEDPERLKFLSPAEIVSALKLRTGMRMADIGAGTGYFTLPMANAVGEAGHIYAVDLQSEMLARLEEKLRGSELQNISLLQGDATRVPLPDACCELVLFANLWHELPDHDRVIKEAIRLLSANGRIAILDWRAELDSPPGPPRHHRISAQSVSDTLQKHGCALVSNQHIGTFSHLVIASVVRFSSPVV